VVVLVGRGTVHQVVQGRVCMVKYGQQCHGQFFFLQNLHK
jgi:hypothetical protein